MIVENPTPMFDIACREDQEIFESALQVVERMVNSGGFSWNRELWADEIAWAIKKAKNNEKHQ